jgi:hypothetical protein
MVAGTAGWQHAEQRQRGDGGRRVSGGWQLTRMAISSPTQPSTVRTSGSLSRASAATFSRSFNKLCTQQHNKARRHPTEVQENIRIRSGGSEDPRSLTSCQKGGGPSLMQETGREPFQLDHRQQEERTLPPPVSTPCFTQLLAVCP